MSAVGPSSSASGVAAAQVLREAVPALVGCSGSRHLLERLEDLLGRYAALPALLFLADRETETFYPAAGLGGDAEAEEIPIAASAGLIDHHHLHPLEHEGEVVGLLRVVPDAEPGAAGAIATVLGPCLIAVQRHEQTVGELRLVHEQMAHLVSAGHLLRLLDLEVLLVEVLQATMRAVDAQVGAVLLPDTAKTQDASDAGGAEGGRSLRIRVTWGLREDHVAAIRFADGVPVADTVFATGERIRIEPDAVAEQLDCRGLDARLTGLMALPLVTGERKQGVVLLANPERPFTPDSQRLAETVCDMAAIAVDNAQLVEGMVERERLGRELAIARRVQADMFPERSLRSGKVSIQGAVRSCDETGGDYYAFLERDGQALAMIADVTGHGLGAALFTTVAHAMIQHQLLAGADLLPALEAVNQGLMLTRSGRFMTAFLAAVDPETGLCNYYSAGHNPILWIHRGEVRWVESIGMPLGILTSYPREEGQQTIELEEGDVLVLYTDGFIESINAQGECWGETRFADHVQRGLAVGLTSGDLIEHIFAGIDLWAEGQPPEDDLTLVLLEYGRRTRS